MTRDSARRMSVMLRRVLALFDRRRSVLSTALELVAYCLVVAAAWRLDTAAGLAAAGVCTFLVALAAAPRRPPS